MEFLAAGTSEGLPSPAEEPLLRVWLEKAARGRATRTR